MCTCAGARTQTDTHANASPRSLPNRTMSPVCCQIKAWKAGHKRECAAAAPSGTRTAAKPTADQMRVLVILKQLADAADWRCVAAQERAARAVAAAVRTSMPGVAWFVWCTLGIAYRFLGDYFKAIEYHKEHLTIAKEVGDRAREGAAYGNLGIGYFSRGAYS
jgi:tetratricopeptide (TPR) repeat protein